MSKNGGTIERLVGNSSLLPEEQTDLLTMLFAIPDKARDLFIDLSRDDPTWIERIYRNWSNKRSAITNRDAKNWNMILAEEETMLEELSKE